VHPQLARVPLKQPLLQVACEQHELIFRFLNVRIRHE
jgi:hypothetical protein